MFSLNFNHSARDMSVFTNSDIQLHVRCPLTGEFDDKANIFSVKIRMCSPLNVKNISRQRNRSSAVSCDPILHWITVTVLLITIIVHIFFWRMSWLFFECFFFVKSSFDFTFYFYFSAQSFLVAKQTTILGAANVSGKIIPIINGQIDIRWRQDPDNFFQTLISSLHRKVFLCIENKPRILISSERISHNF